MDYYNIKINKLLKRRKHSFRKLFLFGYCEIEQKVIGFISEELWKTE